MTLKKRTASSEPDFTCYSPEIAPFAKGLYEFKKGLPEQTRKEVNEYCKTRAVEIEEILGTSVLQSPEGMKKLILEIKAKFGNVKVGKVRA